MLKSTAHRCGYDCWVAVAKRLEGKGALYLEDHAVRQESDEEIKFNGAPGISRFAPFAFDEEGKVVNMSCDMVGVKDVQNYSYTLLKVHCTCTCCPFRTYIIFLNQVRRY